MKKLVIKIGNETHELPYNGEVFSFEVSEKYVPKVGDCVMVEPKGSDILYWCKITETTEKLACFDIVINSKLEVSKKGFFNISDDRVYTKITHEELKAKYAEAGYDWDYETDTIKPSKWKPKDGDEVWCLSVFYKPIKYTLDENDTYFNKALLEKGLLFQTEEECQKFADHCWEFINKK